MFDLKNYVQSLLPVISKTDVVVCLNHEFNIIDSAVSDFYELLNKVKISSKVNDDTNYILKKEINNFKISTVETIQNAVKIIGDNEEEVVELFKNEFSNENLKNITDYYKINLLKYTDSLRFFSDFAKAWANAVLYETLGNVAVIKNDYLLSIASPTLKKDIAFVTNRDNVSRFAISLNILNQPFSKFLESIKNLKGHLYSDDDWGKHASNFSSKLDPYSTGFMPVKYNPVFHIRLSLNAWMHERYERDKVDLARFKLMVQSLEKEKTATIDPKRLENIEKQINYYSNLSNKLLTKIENYEES